MSLNYSDIKKEITSINRTITKKRSEKVKLEQDLIMIGKDKSTIKQRYKLDASKKAVAAKKDFVQSKAQPLEQRRSLLTSSLEKLKKQYKQDLDSISVDSLATESSDKQEILESVKAASDKLHEIIVSMVGERFYNELDKQIPTGELVTDTEKLSEIVDYFNICEVELERLSAKSGKLTKFVDKLQFVIMSIDIGEIKSDSSVDLVIAILVIILFGIGFKYLYPVYLILGLAGFGINLTRHYKIFKILLIQKTVRDNVDSIESLIRQQLIQEVERQKQALTEQFNAEKSKYLAEIDRVNKSIDSVAYAAGSAFKYDDSEDIKNQHLILNQRAREEAQISENIGRIESELKALDIELREKTSLLNNELQQEQMRYLDTSVIGTSFIFDPKFLQNVEGSKLEFWTHPESSALFIYNERKYAIDFIRLILIQLRIRLNPFAYNIDIVDPERMGRDFLKFQPLNKDKSPSIDILYRIFKTEDDFKEEFEIYNAEVSKRLNTIFRSHNSISKYNEFMLSIDSLTETYKFIFIMDPTATSLMDPSLQQIARNGGDLGIFVHFFVSEDFALTPNNRCDEAIQNISKLYTIGNTGAKTKATTWLIEQIEEKRNRRGY